MPRRKRADTTVEEETITVDSAPPSPYNEYPSPPPLPTNDESSVDELDEPTS
jgi:hypothetical protein